MHRGMRCASLCATCMCFACRVVVCACASPVVLSRRSFACRVVVRVTAAGGNVGLRLLLALRPRSRQPSTLVACGVHYLLVSVASARQQVTASGSTPTSCCCNYIILVNSRRPCGCRRSAVQPAPPARTTVAAALSAAYDGRHASCTALAVTGDTCGGYGCGRLSYARVCHRAVFHIRRAGCTNVRPAADCWRWHRSGATAPRTHTVRHRVHVGERLGP